MPPARLESNRPQPTRATRANESPAAFNEAEAVEVIARQYDRAIEFYRKERISCLTALPGHRGRGCSAWVPKRGSGIILRSRLPGKRPDACPQLLRNEQEFRR